MRPFHTYGILSKKKMAPLDECACYLVEVGSATPLDCEIELCSYCCIYDKTVARQLCREKENDRIRM